MKKRILLAGVVVLVLLGLSAASWALAQGSDGEQASTQVGRSTSGSDTDPNAAPEIVIPEKYRAPAGAAPEATSATVYFTPQDNNYNTTVLFLYNTSNSSGIVTIAAFQIDGDQELATSVVVPAGEMVRICADVILNPPSSWASTVLINLRDASAYVKMTVPPGIKADGFVVWGGPDGYDPSVGAYSVPLRFSSDPEAVFLPATLKKSP